MPIASNQSALDLSGRILDGARGIAMFLLFPLVSLGPLRLFSRLSWVYLKTPRVKIGHRFSYQFREILPFSPCLARASLP